MVTGGRRPGSHWVVRRPRPPGTGGCSPGRDLRARWSAPGWSAPAPTARRCPRYLQAEGIRVIDVNQPDRATRGKRGKTDAVDAETAARAVLSGRSASIAKTGDGMVESMRLLKLARDSAVNARTKAINQLTAILVGADPALRESLAALGPGSLIRACAALRDPGEPSEVQRTAISRRGCWRTGSSC